MAKNANGRKPVTESRIASKGGCGYEVKMMRSREQSTGGAVVALRGGLMDINSVTLEPLAEAVHELSDGKVSVALVGTIRPINPLEAIKAAFAKNDDSIARYQRSFSTYKAAKYLRDRYQPDSMVLGGHSEGAISVTDAVHHWHTSAKTPGDIPKMGVVTIDGLSAYGPIEEEVSALGGLKDIVIHCLPEIKALGIRKGVAVLGNIIQHPNSVFEPLYVAGELRYLPDVDISPVLDNLSLEVGVRKVCHDRDIVPGAEKAINDPNARVFEGGHIRVMREPEPVATYILELAEQLQEMGPMSQAV